MTALALKANPAIESSDFELPIPADFRLASGDVLADTHIVGRWIGNRDAAPIVALGGISAGRDVCGPNGWWRETLLTHNGVNLQQRGVIGFEFAPIANARVRITPHDQARLIELALEQLGVARLHAFVGASYGAMVGLAFAAHAPRLLGRLCVISAAGGASAQALAWRGVQRRIVEWASEHGDEAGGLSLARQLAMITYRTPAEFEARFGAGVGADGRGEIDRYLEARGQAYARTMPPQRWLSLSEAIDRFSVDPATVRTPTTLVACPDDQLAPIEDVRRLGARLPNLRKFQVLSSLYGHDAFLKEPARLGPFIARFLEEPAYG